MKTRIIEISEKTYEKIKDQITDEIIEINNLIGKSFLFRTVTYHMVGKVVKRVNNFLELETASWVAESARFMQTIKTGELNEVEPVGIAFLNLETVVDFFPWPHKLPVDQK